MPKVDTSGEVRKELGYWIPLEGTKDPGKLLDYAKKSEQIGFKSICLSDHFHPWRNSGTFATFPWTWMSSGLEATKRAVIGTGVTCPTFRYHPAIVAQAFASMDHIYPGRVFLSVGTGELLNEAPLGFPWPPYSERKERLVEAISIIRKLWREEFVNFEGKHYKLDKAKLYTKPKTRIPIYVGAEGPKSARMAGRYGDGIFTPLHPGKRLEDVIFPAFREGVKEGGKDLRSVEKLIEARISFDQDYERALESCRPWKVTTLLDHIEKEYDPREFEKFEEDVADQKLEKYWKIATEVDEIIVYLEKLFEFGFTKVFVHSSSPDESEFLEASKEKILPYFLD